jgi:hypothetical protein
VEQVLAGHIVASQPLQLVRLQLALPAAAAARALASVANACLSLLAAGGGCAGARA